MKTNPNDAVGVVVEAGRLMESGLTKREYFAAMAMQGLLAFGNSESYVREETLPSAAVKFADALIKELNKPT